MKHVPIESRKTRMRSCCFEQLALSMKQAACKDKNVMGPFPQGTKAARVLVRRTITGDEWKLLPVTAAGTGWKGCVRVRYRCAKSMEEQ